MSLVTAAVKSLGQHGANGSRHWQIRLPANEPYLTPAPLLRGGGESWGGRMLDSFWVVAIAWSPLSLESESALMAPKLDMSPVILLPKIP